MGKNNQNQKSQHVLTLCYLPPLGILQAVLKFVTVAVVYYISLAETGFHMQIAGDIF